MVDEKPDQGLNERENSQNVYRVIGCVLGVSISAVIVTSITVALVLTARSDNYDDEGRVPGAPPGGLTFRGLLGSKDMISSCNDTVTEHPNRALYWDIAQSSTILCNISAQHNQPSYLALKDSDVPWPKYLDFIERVHFFYNTGYCKGTASATSTSNILMGGDNATNTICFQTSSDGNPCIIRHQYVSASILSANVSEVRTSNVGLLSISNEGYSTNNTFGTWRYWLMDSVNFDTCHGEPCNRLLCTLELITNNLEHGISLCGDVGVEQ